MRPIYLIATRKRYGFTNSYSRNLLTSTRLHRWNESGHATSERQISTTLFFRSSPNRLPPLFDSFQYAVGRTNNSRGFVDVSRQSSTNTKHPSYYETLPETVTDAQGRAESVQNNNQTSTSNTETTTTTNSSSNNDNSNSNISIQKNYHDKMVAWAEGFLYDTGNRSGEQGASSSFPPDQSATMDALKVIRYFHNLKFHGLTRLQQQQPLKSLFSGNAELDSTGPMLAKIILNKLFLMDQKRGDNTQYYVSHLMFHPIIYGFSTVPNGSHLMLCFEQAKEVLNMFQQWTLMNQSRFWTEGEKQQLRKSHMISFNILLKILVRIGTVQSAERAQGMLLELSELYDKDTTGILPRPDVVSFNTALRAWYQSVIASHEKGRNKESIYCAEKAEELLRFMQTLQGGITTTRRDLDASLVPRHLPSPLQPNRSSYNIVIDSWASLGNVERVESLMKQMERASSKGSREGGGANDIYPCRRTFKSVINAYKNSKGDKYKKVAHIAAMNMLRCLEDLNEKFYMDVRPDTDVLNDVINCWLISDVDDAPFQIDALVERMEQLRKAGQFHLQPNLYTYRMAFAAWNTSAVRGRDSSFMHEAPKRAERHLREMVKLVKRASDRHRNSRNDNLRYSLSSNHFDAVLSLYSQCSKDASGELAEKADDILALMQNCYRSGMPWVKPTFDTYRHLFEIWSKSEHPDRGRRCEELLLLMENMPQEKSNQLSPVPQLYYKKTIDALLSSKSVIDHGTSNKGYYDAVWSAEAVLQRMIEKSKGGDLHQRRLNGCYVSVATALSKLKIKAASDRAKELLRQSVDVEAVGSKLLAELDTLNEKGLPLTKDHIAHYSKLIASFSRAQSNLSAEMAKRVFFKVDELSRKIAGSEKPDFIMANTVLNACSKCDFEGAKKAHALLDHLEEREKEYGVFVLDKISYCTVINAWGKSDDDNAPAKVLELLDKMEERWLEEKNLSVKPDLDVYTCAILNILQRRLHKSTKMAQIAYDKMIAAKISLQPTLAMKLIEACCRVGESERAETVLESSELILKSSPAEGNGGDYSDFLIQALQLILNSNLRSTRRDRIERAEKILRRLLALCDANKPWTIPKTADIISVLNAHLTYNKDCGAECAYEILNNVIELQNREAIVISLSKQIFDKVLDSLVNCKANMAGKLSEIGEMADRLLAHMKDPDQYSYSLGILAWSCSKHPDKGERAQLLFDRMCHSCTFIPEPHVYQSLLDAWANGSSKEKAERAQLVLSSLVEKSRCGENVLNPTVHHFNSVLQACVHTPSTGNGHVALRVAMAVFRELHEMPSVEPNENTFQIMFQVCKRFIDDREKRDKLSEKLFREACLGGFLTQRLLEKFWDVSSHDLRKRCLGEYLQDASAVSVSNFPDEWRCKVNQSKNAV